jgi:fucose permease
MRKLLVIIYLAFISLGLPDALLGSSWTVMRLDINAPLEFAGLISFLICGATVVSSLMTAKVLEKIGTVKLVIFSIVSTAIALIGFSLSMGVGMIILFAIPLGLGAGAVDATLNNYVAINYDPKHMNWLHCFWGLGATGGPLMLSWLLSVGRSWRMAYSTVGLIQLIIVFTIFLSVPLWKEGNRKAKEKSKDNNSVSNRTIIKIKGVKITMLIFFIYCSLELTVGLWAASFLTVEREIVESTAALWISFYYASITIGRLISGVISIKIDTGKIIKIGLRLIFIGVIVLLIPLPSISSMVGLMLIGLGCAPIFPNMIHIIPNKYDKNISQRVIGLSMASAYLGSTFTPSLIGFISSNLSFGVYPYIIAGLSISLIILNRQLNNRFKNGRELVENT